MCRMNFTADSDLPMKISKSKRAEMLISTKNFLKKLMRLNGTKEVRYIIGIDEVGRGSLAGPVVVAAVAVPHDLRFSSRGGSAPGGKIPAYGEARRRRQDLRRRSKLKDSKQLTAIQREKWSAYLRAHPHIRYAVAKAMP